MERSRHKRLYSSQRLDQGPSYGNTGTETCSKHRESKGALAWGKIRGEECSNSFGNIELFHNASVKLLYDVRGKFE